MNVDKFFEQHSIEEISKKTKISPISLRFIKNKEFEKIPRVKFIGFIRLIEREYGIDLSELIEEYNSTVKNQSSPTPQKIKVQKKETPIILYILIALTLLISGAILYKTTQPTKTAPIKNNLEFSIAENNASTITTQNDMSIIENNLTYKIEEENTSLEENKTKKISINEITIIPKEKVWYRIINLDTNKTYEYLTTKIHSFKGKNFYIKLGHGNVTIEYGDYNITPNTKKIVKILLKNGKYEYVKGLK